MLNPVFGRMVIWPSISVCKEAADRAEPISTCIFILYAEALCHTIRQDNTIRGIDIGGLTLSLVSMLATRNCFWMDPKGPYKAL